MRKSLKKAIASLLAVALIVGTWSNGSVTAYATEDGAAPVAETQESAAPVITLTANSIVDPIPYDAEGHSSGVTVSVANATDSWEDDGIFYFKYDGDKYRFRIPSTSAVTNVGEGTLVPNDITLQKLVDYLIFSTYENCGNKFEIIKVNGTATVIPATEKVDFYVVNPDRGLFEAEYIEIGSGTIVGQVVSPHDANGFWGNEIIRFGEFSKIGDNYTITYPTSYPEIRVGRTTYTYDPAGNRANTYSIKWENVKAVKEFLSEYSYHCNGSVVLQKENLYNVVFSVEQPGVGFVEVDKKENVTEGTALTAPVAPEFAGYVFVGWYADAAFTTPADLTALSADSNYYGKYVEIQTLTLVPAVSAVTYDGKTHIVNSFETTQFGDVTVSGLSVYAEGTDAGSYDVAVTGTAVVTDANGNDVTKFYNVNVASAKLVIEKKNATISSLSASKQYDGTALTYPQFLMEGFVGNEVPEVVVTGSLTEIGTANNTFRVVYGEGIKESNYNVKLVVGKLTVTAVEGLVVTFDNVSKTYDGTALVGSYSANMDLVAGHSFDIALPSTTNVGTVANTAAVKIVDAAGKDVTDHYANIQVVDGTLTVVPVEGLVVTFNNATKTYDGKPLVGSYSANMDLVAGHSFEVVLPSIKDAGTAVNTAEVKIVDASGNDMTANYDLSVVSGNLTVTKREVILKTNSATKTYDGTALTNGEYGYFKPFLSGETPTLVFTGSQTNAGSSENTVEFVFPEGVKAENYDITVVPGYLTVNKAVIKVVSASDSKVYDGTALTNNVVTVTGTYANGETPEYVFTGTQTNAGDSRNVFEVVFPANVKAENYDVTTEFGTLTVTKAPSPVIYMKQNVVVVYGQNLESDLIDRIEGLVDGHKFTINIDRPKDTTTKTVGTYSNSFGTWGKATIKCGDEDVTANYEKATTKRGSYIVVPATAPEVTFVNAEARTYGDDLSADYTFNFAEAGYNDKYVLEVSGVPTYVPAGSYTFKVAEGQIVAVKDGQDAFAMDYVVYAANDASKADLKSNFAGLTVSGAWEVAKRDVSITSSGSFRTYNGSPLTVNTVIYTPFTGTAHFLDGEEPIYTVTGSQLNAGSSQNTFTYEFPAGVDANNYDVHVTYGTLTVNKRAVTVASAGADKQYDATPLTAKTVNVISELDFVEGDVVAFNFTGSQTNAGTSENTFTVEFKDEQTAANYELTTLYGTLAVTQAEKAFLKFKDYIYVAYGQELPEDLYTVRNLMPGHELTNVTFIYPENVSTMPVGSTFRLTTRNHGDIKIMDGDVDVTANYKGFSRAEGTLVIVAAEAPTVSFVNENRKYGDDLSADYTFDFVEAGYDEKYVVEVSGMPTYVDAGSYGFKVENGQIVAVKDGQDAFAMDYVIYAANDESKEDLKSNFKEVKVEGTWEVAKREVNLYSPSRTMVYDGTPVTTGGVEMGYGDEFLEGEKPEFTYTANQVNVGSSQNTFTYAFPAGVNADNYDLDINYGTLTVTKRPVTVKSADAERQYKLQPLTANEANVTSELGFVEGDVIGYDFTGSQNVPGSSANTFTVEFAEGKAENYDLTVEYGTLTVNPITGLVITFGDVEKEYDGTPISMPFEKLVNVSPMLIGHKVVFNESEVPVVTDVAESTNYTVSFKIMEGTKDVTAFYTDVTVNAGRFTVTPREGAVVTFADAEKVYDGTALVGEVTATGLAEGQTLKVTTPGIVDAGEKANTAEFAVVDANGKDVTANYADIEVKEGLLTITKRPVTIETGSASKAYDGTGISNHNATVTPGEDLEVAFVNGDTPVYDFTESRTYLGSNPNTVEVKVMNGEVDVTNNYDITYVPGTLTITKCPVTVKIVGNHMDAQYTGAEYEVSGYNVEFSNNLYKTSDFTFTGNAVVRGTMNSDNFYYMGLSAADFVNNSINFDVTFEVTDGYLFIYAAPAPVQEPEVEEPVVDQPVVEEPVVEEEEETTEPEVEVEVVEETTPVVSDDLVEIEDEETPLANLKEDGGNGPIFWILFAGLLATVALFVFFVVLRKTREEEEEEA